MKKSIIKKLFVTGMLSSLAFTNVACNDSAVVPGVIIGGVIGGVVAGSTSDSNDHNHRRRHRKPTYDRHRGDRHHDRHRGRRPGRGRHHNLMAESMSMAPQMESNFALISNVNTEKSFADYYGISELAAADFIDLMDRAERGDRTALDKIGIPLSEFVKLSKNELPHQVYINQMAFNLNMAANKAKVILLDMLDEANYQFADVNSLVWKKCTSLGKWHTPEKTNCSSKSTTGCSPMTGATKCIPAM